MFASGYRAASVIELVRKSKIEKGELGFEQYYQKVYGGRWDDLKESLKRPQGEHVEFRDGLVKPYYLDGASVAAAGCLQVKPGDRVLDLCAAPGGKTLVLVSGLKGRGELVANEISNARRLRLLKVLREHLPAETLSLVSLKGFDGASAHRRNLGIFDKILVDAPCSSERHVLQDQTALKQWSPARIKRLILLQRTLLRSAVQMLKSGGALLYSTCSVNPGENDGVIGKILSRQKEPLRSEAVAMEWGMTAEYGWEIFPDQCGGRGPMYIAKIIRQ